MKSTLAGRDLPEDVKQRILSLHEEGQNLKDQNKSLTEKLNKAKQVGNWPFMPNFTDILCSLLRTKTNCSRNSMLQQSLLPL